MNPCLSPSIGQNPTFPILLYDLTSDSPRGTTVPEAVEGCILGEDMGRELVEELDEVRVGDARGCCEGSVCVEDGEEVWVRGEESGELCDGGHVGMRGKVCWRVR